MWRTLGQSIASPVISTSLYFIVFCSAIGKSISEIDGIPYGSFIVPGFIIGIWADSFEKLQMVPLLIITPLTFLGGSFYSIDMLPPFWQKVSLLNPVVYLISGFRWSFYGSGDVSVCLSLCMITLFLIIGILTVRIIFKTGWRLKS